MRLHYGKDFEQFLEKNLEDVGGRSFEEMGFPSITLELKGGTKIKHFLPKFEGVDTTKIGDTEYLIKTGSELRVHDIDNNLIDERGLKIAFNKGKYSMMNGVKFYPVSEFKEPEDIVSRMLIDGNLEAEFIAVRPEELSDSWIYRQVIGERHYMIPKRNLVIISIQERIGGTERMAIFQTCTGFYLNHKKDELASLYPIVSF